MKRLMEKNENYIKGCKELEYKNFKIAISYFSKALEEDPDDIESLIKRTDSYMEIDDHNNYNKDLFLQIRIYTKQLKKNPCNHELLYKRGEKHQYLYKYTKAISDFEKAIELYPKYVEAYIGLGSVMMHNDEGDLNQAINVFFQAISIQPNNSQALYNIALIYYRQENSEKAIEYYKKCIETKGDYSPIAYRSLSSLYSKLNRYDEAIACLKEVIRDNLSFDSDYSKLASLYKRIGDIDEAIFHQSTAVAIDNNNQFNYFELSQLYVKSNNFEMALNNINRAISIENRRSFFQCKAKLLLKLDKTEEAEKIFDEVWNSWEYDYKNLKKLALRKDVTSEEVSQLKPGLI